MSLVSLLQIAHNLDAPVMAIAMEAQTYLAPRFLRGAGVASEAIWPTRSLLAGSQLSVPVAKKNRFPAPQQARVVRPRSGAQLWSFIDDAVA